MKSLFVFISIFIFSTSWAQWNWNWLRAIYDDYTDYQIPGPITFSDMNGDGKLDFMFRAFKLPIIAKIYKNQNVIGEFVSSDKKAGIYSPPVDSCQFKRSEKNWFKLNRFVL